LGFDHNYLVNPSRFLPSVEMTGYSESFWKMLLVAAKPPPTTSSFSQIKSPVIPNVVRNL